MANPPRQLPIPTAIPSTPTAWRHLRARLGNWVDQVGAGFAAQQQREIVVTMTTATTGTVPFVVSAHPDGTPNAQLVADGVVLHWVASAPGPGEWTMETGIPTVSDTTITLGSTATLVWFAWLIAR